MKKFIRILCLVGVFIAAGAALDAQAVRLVRFGLITDTHVSDKADQSPAISLVAAPRYFTGGLAKIEAFVREMNRANADFVVELGDFTDNPVNGSLSYDKRKAVVLGFLDNAEGKLALFKGPRYHVLGNHDTDQLSKEEVGARVLNSGIEVPSGQYYYSYNQGGVHFIVLDASFTSTGNAYSGVPGAAGYGYQWSDANVPAAELAWLKADLAATKLPTIVFTHQLLNPEEQVDAAFDPAHSIKNAAEVRSMLEKSGIVMAAIAGHYHDGGYQQVNGIHYVTLQASAAYGNDASYHNQYSTVDVYQDGRKYQIAIAGNGGSKSYVLSSTLP
ncbi:MAG: metallophosphoesterase [Rectinemataceae bacterium]|nr:metallophosphoesterase [Rectinemataceae bacterium]